MQTVLKQMFHNTLLQVGMFETSASVLFLCPFNAFGFYKATKNLLHGYGSL